MADMTAADSYEAPEAPASATSTRADQASKAGLTVDHIDIQPSDNGGFIATCYKKAKSGHRGLGGLSMPEPSKHTFDHYYDLEEYLADTFGVPQEEQEPASEEAGETPEEEAAEPSGGEGEGAGGGEAEGETGAGGGPTSGEED